jgi:hypothetical protein
LVRAARSYIVLFSTEEELRLYFIAGIIGLAAGIIVWYLISIAIGHSISWAETRRPELAGSTRVRVGEIVACSAAFAGSLLFAFWLARFLTEHMKK